MFPSDANRLDTYLSLTTSIRQGIYRRFRSLHNSFTYSASDTPSRGHPLFTVSVYLITPLKTTPLATVSHVLLIFSPLSWHYNHGRLDKGEESTFPCYPPLTIVLDLSECLSRWKNPRHQKQIPLSVRFH